MVAFHRDSTVYQIVQGPFTDAFGERTWMLRSVDSERATFKVREETMDREHV